MALERHVMKWPKDQFDIVVDGMRQFRGTMRPEHIEPLREALKESDATLIRLGNAVDYDLQYPDTHPAYSAGVWDDGTVRPARVRRVQYNPKYVVYPPGCNDDHRKTMLKRAAKEAGLLP